MYARTVGKKDLTFTVSGMLWRRSLVMEDEETESHWSHLLGRAMAGELKGSELEMIPSVMTDWKAWKAQYPSTDVLDMKRTTNLFITQMQKEPGAYTVGLRLDGKVVDYPFDILKEAPVINATTGRTVYLVSYDVESATPRMFDRTVSGNTLTFSMKGNRLAEARLIDAETSSIWDPFTGVCHSGKLKGTKLKMLPCIPSFVKAWQAFYPKSETYSPDSAGKAK